MKSFYILLALAGAGTLPACTVNYYGVRPGDPGYGTVREYHSTDTVYVNGSTATVITQPGTVGAPGGSYPGPGWQTPPPPPIRNGAGQPAGTSPTTAGNYPPPRNNGGVRPPVRNGGPAGTAPTSPPTLPPATTPASGTTAQTPPVRTPSTGGVVPPASTGSNPPTINPGTGGVKPVPPAPATPPVGSPVVSGTEVAGGTKGGIRTGGIKPAPTGPTTGGVKPIPTPAPVPAPTPSGATPVSTGSDTASPIVVPAGGTGLGGIRTGGIKPSRGSEMPTTPVPASGGFQTGGIKPIPSSAPGTPPASTGSASLPPTSEGTAGGTKTGGIRTGGIKPSREGTPPTTSAGDLVLGTGRLPVRTGTSQVQPVLLFSKMPCRGTCPSYTATVWPDGRVTYVGQQNVPRLGTFELQLDPAVVGAMQRQAQQVHFTDLPATFTSGNTDVPASVLTMYGPKGSSKTVTVEAAAPADVQALFDTINSTISDLAATSKPAGGLLPPRPVRGR